jgi:hypothetical protein
MTKLLKWIRKYRSQIIGFGKYVYGEKYGEDDQEGMYLVIPVSLIAFDYGITDDEVLYGSNEEE